MSKTTMEQILKFHNPEAIQNQMVYEVWNDGEITLTKGGDLFRRRSLHSVGGKRIPSWPTDKFPLKLNNFGSIAVNSMEEAEQVVELLSN